MDEPTLSDQQWETELKQAMREIQRGEYRKRKANYRRNVSPWVL